MQSNTAPKAAHPRRPPAHLSVSLKHGKSPRAAHASAAQNAPVSMPSSSPKRPSNGKGSESGNGAQKWFNNANENSARGVEDNDPPFFLKRSNSSTSNPASDNEDNLREHLATRLLHPAFAQHAYTIDSSADDFRSVIDDLTIQNKKLKERLRKYESSFTSHLEKEKLFEVKVHGLPSHKRRELEETLRSFASSVSASRVTSIKPHASEQSRDSHASRSRSTYGNGSSSSTSNSRPVDSAYASMNSSEPKSAARHHVQLGKKDGERRPKTHEQKVESYLHDIPEGLLPKHYPGLTEKAKKKIVVRRLEQLFTGKRGDVDGPKSQPLQQQEISASAARADREASDGVSHRVVKEGVREAHILPTEMEIDPPKGSTFETARSSGSSGSDPENAAPEQRPTRPLDLDPERAQVPNDNIQYIRHLGLESPKIINSDTTDSGGWIYLNLLVSMAQLHMINVTPDFIRSAVSEVSDKFELSRDGRKLRWRGGSDGTKLSSDSGAESLHRSPTDSDSFDESTSGQRNNSSWKERTQTFPHSKAQFRSVSMSMPGNATQAATNKTNACYYKPLFKHMSSSTEDESMISESDGPNRYAPAEINPRGAAPSGHAVTQRNASGKKRGDEGVLVFYTGASFCIDMSAEADSIPVPSHNRAVGRDGYSNHTHDALGCGPAVPARAKLQRTDSGSLLMFRPFKDYSKSGELLNTSNERPRSPTQVTSSDEDDDMLEFNPQWSTLDAAKASERLDLTASGLGGIRPADHFEVVVETKHERLDAKSRARLSKFSAPSPKRRKFVHSVSRSSLDSFRDPGRSAESITSRLAALRADSPPVSTANNPIDRVVMPVKAQIISTKLRPLEPSPLPPPAMWYAESSFDSYSDDKDSSEQEIDRLRQRKPWMHSAPPRRDSSTEIEEMNDASAPKADQLDQPSSSSDDDMDIDSDDESIDMLAAAREADPAAVAAQEAEFERESTKKLDQIPFGSSAATVDGRSGECGSGWQSGQSSYGSISSDEEDDDDDDDEDDD